MKIMLILLLIVNIGFCADGWSLWKIAKHGDHWPILRLMEINHLAEHQNKQLCKDLAEFFENSVYTQNESYICQPDYIEYEQPAQKQSNPKTPVSLKLSL